ncbi:hypothetical protein Dimus_024866, partial [Dionaea muscipula]
CSLRRPLPPSGGQGTSVHLLCRSGRLRAWFSRPSGFSHSACGLMGMWWLAPGLVYGFRRVLCLVVRAWSSDIVVTCVGWCRRLSGLVSAVGGSVRCLHGEEEEGDQASWWFWDRWRVWWWFVMGDGSGGGCSGSVGGGSGGRRPPRVVTGLGVAHAASAGVPPVCPLAGSAPSRVHAMSAVPVVLDEMSLHASMCAVPWLWRRRGSCMNLETMRSRVILGMRRSTLRIQMMEEWAPAWWAFLTGCFEWRSGGSWIGARLLWLREMSKDSELELRLMTWLPLCTVGQIVFMLIAPLLRTC